MSVEADIVRTYFMAFNAHDLEGVMDCFTADAVILSSDGQRCTGAAQVRRHYESIFKMFPDAHCELTRACGSEGTAAAESVFTGTQPHHGHQTRFTGAELLTIRDDRISELRDYHSAATE
jgi:uncharacterized protein (TIGR02246 family)